MPLHAWALQSSSVEVVQSSISVRYACSWEDMHPHYIAAMEAIHQVRLPGLTLSPSTAQFWKGAHLHSR